MKFVCNVKDESGNIRTGYEDILDADTREEAIEDYLYHIREHEGLTEVTEGDLDIEEKRIELVGVKEAAELLGWDKGKVSVYLARGILPEPIQRLASGPIWTREQIERYKDKQEE
jgi:hypothetical protein